MDIETQLALAMLVSGCGIFVLLIIYLVCTEYDQ